MHAQTVPVAIMIHSVPAALQHCSYLTKKVPHTATTPIATALKNLH
jgi:hypothetical protein